MFGIRVTLRWRPVSEVARAPYHTLHCAKPHLQLRTSTHSHVWMHRLLCPVIRGDMYISSDCQYPKPHLQTIVPSHICICKPSNLSRHLNIVQNNIQQWQDTEISHRRKWRSAWHGCGRWGGCAVHALHILLVWIHRLVIYLLQIWLPSNPGHLLALYSKLGELLLSKISLISKISSDF